MSVSIDIHLSAPFKDEDAQSLQMLATGIAIMAGGELAAQIAANTEAAEQEVALRLVEQYGERPNGPTTPEIEHHAKGEETCGRVLEDPLGGPAQVCISKAGHRGRHAWREQPLAH